MTLASKARFIRRLHGRGSDSALSPHRGLCRLGRVSHQVSLFHEPGRHRAYCFSAVKGGADRLEVCANLGVGGGTTPSVGLVRAIQRVVDVPLMVRPVHHCLY